MAVTIYKLKGIFDLKDSCMDQNDVIVNYMHMCTID